MDLIKNGNLVRGAGKLFWDPENDDGDLTGEIYLGYTPNFATPISSETMDYWNPDQAVEERVEAIQRRVTRDMSFQCDNISAFVLSLFYLGEASTKTQSADSVTGESLNGGTALIADRWYQLGQDDDNPSGVRNVSNVVITADPDGTPAEATVDTDYELDAATGRFRVIPDGALDDAVAEADYDTVADEREQIVTEALGSKYGALRYVADNSTGPNRDVYIPRILLTPNGEAAWKDQENWMGLQFQGMMLKRTGRPQLVIDGRAVATS